MEILLIILQVAAVLMAVTFHEVAHGWVAYRLGDPTAKLAGRLTLNPIKHLDPFGSVILPLLLAFSGGILFGWAKPVPVNFRALRNLRHDAIMVSVAGVAANLACALAAGFVVRFLLQAAPAGSDLIYMILLFLTFFVYINTILAVFNLFPLPPLDGGRILVMVLPGPLGARLDRLQPFSMLILVVLLFSGVAGSIISFFTEPVLSLALGQDGMVFFKRCIGP